MRIKRTPKCRPKMILPSSHKAELPGFMSVAWLTGDQLLVFFCSSVPVVLVDTPRISRCRPQHVVSVELSSLFHHSIYPWFIRDLFPAMIHLHKDRKTINECFEP